MLLRKEQPMSETPKEKQKRFIEVRKIVTDKSTKMNTHSEPRSLDIDDIKSFRRWHKSDKDSLIKGEMTQIMLESDTVYIIGENKKPHFPTMLIEEGYEDFAYRLSQRVPVNRVNYERA